MFVSCAISNIANTTFPHISIDSWNIASTPLPSPGVELNAKNHCPFANIVAFTTEDVTPASAWIEYCRSPVSAVIAVPSTVFVTPSSTEVRAFTSFLIHHFWSPVISCTVLHFLST